MLASLSARTSAYVWLSLYLVATFGSAVLANTGIVPGWPGLILFGLSFLLLFPMIRSVERAQAACGIKSTAARRYNRRVVIASLAYVVALLCGVAFVRYYHPAIALRVLIAVAVAVPVIFIIRAAALLITEESDEFLRLLYVRQNLVATGVLLTAATLYGFLNTFDVAPRVDAWAAVPLWAVGLGIGAAVNKFTLGTAGRC